MWVHRTPEEVKDRRRQLWTALGGPFLLALVVGAGVIVMHLLGFGPKGKVPKPMSAAELVAYGATIGLAAGAFGFVFQLVFGTRLSESGIAPSTVLICDKCYRTKSADGEQTCECGGTFEDFDLWKWVDEPAGDEDAGCKGPSAAASLGLDTERGFGADAPRSPDEIELEVASWEGRVARLREGNLKVRGMWNPAVLTRRGKRTLILEAKHDPPGTGVLALAATAIAAAIGALFNVPMAFIGFLDPPMAFIPFLASFGMSAYVAILLCRRRRMRLRVDNAGYAIVDQHRSRIGLFLQFDREPRWVVLEFKESFADAADAIRDALGVKCRAGTIGGGHVWSVIFWLLVGFAIAFGYFRMRW